MLRRPLVLLIVAATPLLSMGCSDSDPGAHLSTTEATNPSAPIPVLLPDEVLPPNEPHQWELAVHCGAALISYRINGIWWRAVEGSGLSWMPTEWGDINGRTSGVPVVLELNATGDQLSATYAGRTVVYRPTDLTEADLCD